MSRSPLPALLLAAATVALAGCTGPSPATAEPDFTLSGSGTTVGVLATDLGAVLVGPGDRTLYLFDGAGPCVDACADQFPPYLAEGVPTPAGAALTGLDVAELGTSAGGQVTYRDVPLHLYRGDTAPGSVAGQELTAFGGTFRAVNTQGAGVLR